MDRSTIELGGDKADQRAHRVLAIDNLVLSMHSRMLISDEHGRLVYECGSHIGLIGPAWTIKQGGHEIAGMHRAIGMTSKWHVDGRLGKFDVRRPLISLSHSIDVEGGPFNGATLHGNVLDRTFYLMHHGERLAQATAALLSVSDHHTIELFAPGAEVELMVVIGLVGVHAEHLRERPE